MGVQNLVCVSPPDLIDEMSTDRLRPQSLARWENNGAGGTSTYTVLHEWDTSSGFGSGALITDTNVVSSSTFEDIGIPPGDLGPAGTLWYYQFTVTDDDDAGSLTLPSYLTMDFADPKDANHTLYAALNVGGAFAVGELDDARASKRVLYAPINIGAGFQFGGPDDATASVRSLYVPVEVTTDVPIPYITYLEPTYAEAGDAIVVHGQGFDNVARDWSAEVRLYDSATLDGSYVVMAEIDFTPGATEDLFVVTVPTGQSSGWVVVVNNA